MKLEENMYVRTLKGIVKIDEIKEDVMKDTKGYLHYGDFIKASYNIIDLIEVGDYVNGEKVLLKNEGYIKVGTGRDYIVVNNEKFIKSIVTKEQFENIKYSLEG